MKIKTSELTGAALDWAVAQCEGHLRTDGGAYPAYQGRVFRPSTEWALGGPIIEREGIAISPSAAGLKSWVADTPLRPTSFADKTRCSGTPLIAAMRCYVASKLGDEVEVPDALTSERQTPIMGSTN